MAQDKTIRVRLIVVDEYLSFRHGLYKGIECDAIPNYTSTKKLKGYIIKSMKDHTSPLYIKINEVEIL